MPSGKAPIAETSTVDSLLARHWSHRRPVPTGVLAVLTMVFWAAWLYLVLPLVSLLLWAFGVRFFIEQLRLGSYEGLRASLLAYSSVLIVLVALLALWIAWNVKRYGGSSDRRTVKREEVPDAEVRQAFRLDESLHVLLRDQRLVRVDMNGGGIVVIANEQPRVESRAPGAGADGGAGPQRGRETTRSG
jgi:poly-beta-1,6-N-acetyl-D-glucosamine biosynthesis protein PgaD